jgi:hypothetical protein
MTPTGRSKRSQKAMRGTFFRGFNLDGCRTTALLQISFFKIAFSATGANLV